VARRDSKNRLIHYDSGGFRTTRLYWNYFFLYPAGHTGLTAVTFFVILPLTQVMVFLAGGIVVVVVVVVVVVGATVVGEA